MGWHKWTESSQGNTMEQYTTLVPLPQHQSSLEGSGDDLSVLVHLAEVRRLEALLQDAEGRSWQNNVRLLVFPERAEGNATEAFVENWIRDVLQPAGLSRVFVVERAHRALVAPPLLGSPPRAIIACLLNYKDLVCVLRAARKSDRAVFENCKISIYPDYTNKVQSSQKGFLEVKGKLRAMNIKYMSWGASPRTSGANGPDWRSCNNGQLEDAVAHVSAKDSAHRVEIQQDGTMAVVSTGLAGGVNGELDRGTERVPAQV
ncbi:hypothetical protein NDU88_007085 [Pleurodeles waltl]|uniref:Uncharacterized protein n=1 Tax=Pleurodeles waltl TaxID=8319 RepID=A0AAV7QMZ6_PLEWA|nr:hypothetical protein NDU88_007085 [Pleurodeles waltl]